MTKQKVMRPSTKKLSPRASIRKVDYEKDFVKWAETQAGLLKIHRLEELDITNLIDEIESLGISQRKAIKSYCVVLLTHLLKQKYQPDNDCNSWRSSIANARRELKLLLEYSPSLKKELEKIFEDAYESARKDASYETKIPLKEMEKTCPWKIKQALGN